MKDLEFRGSSREELIEFPSSAKKDAGYELDRVQRGLEPFDWKPMKTIGAGVREIRIKQDGGAFRVIYVAKFEEAIYVLHAFEKKSQKTPQKSIAIAQNRYRELVTERAAVSKKR